MIGVMTGGGGGGRRLLPDLVGHLAVSSEARKFYCPCFTDVEAKAQRCQEVSSQSWIPHPGGFQSATRVRGSGVSSQSVTPLAFSTILFRITPVLIFALPTEHLRYTSTGKDFFFCPPLCRK